MQKPASDVAFTEMQQWLGISVIRDQEISPKIQTHDPDNRFGVNYDSVIADIYVEFTGIRQADKFMYFIQIP